MENTIEGHVTSLNTKGIRQNSDRFLDMVPRGLSLTRMTRRSILVLAASVAFGLAVAPPARADFTFTNIAVSGDPFGVFGPPAINASGTAAFFATFAAGGSGVFTGGGGPIVTVAETG